MTGTTTYHTTIPTTQRELSDYEKITQRQDEKILEHLRKNYPATYTAEQLAVVLDAPMLMTSIRRALTDLNRARKINRVGYQTGTFGRRIGVYQFNAAVVV
ncbi:MAG: hypothetical protein M0Q91_13315 [Methanoregula sp.]|jgi:predicted ArsR family transcriptional regulator|nr:hypothetical protein [Methanoregula sp.]